MSKELAGLKGYVTNLPASKMDGAAVIAAYCLVRRAAPRENHRMLPQ
ncbi:MAG TPA: hypothetical protein VF070_27585 [Streptosporangiaceae bacterium]